MDGEDPHGWPEPVDLRSRYRLCQVAFFLAAVGAVLSCLTFACRGLGFAMTLHPWWERLVRAPSLMTTLFAAFILIGRWPDRRWRARATALAIFATYNVGIWAIDQSEVLGLPTPPVELREDALKLLISAFFGCLVVVLLSGSADDICRHLHSEGSAPLARGAHLVAGLAAALVAVVMANLIDWGHGWPFHIARRMDVNTFFMYLGWMLCRAIAAAFLALVCAQACACCGEEADRIDRARRDDDPFRVWTK